MLFNAPETISEEIIEYFSTYEPPVEKTPAEKGFEKPAGVSPASGDLAPVSERIKSAIPVRQFVLRYVELSPAGRGLCPFHDDEHPSLSVNDDKNYWHCFACGQGGSVIDFYMQLKECDFKTAVAELADTFLPK